MFHYICLLKHLISGFFVRIFNVTYQNLNTYKTIFIFYTYVIYKCFCYLNSFTKEIITFSTILFSLK